mmetsp:Transcript_7797/g.26851  ORF Transcript_7797/g.26851 Transcript_7797/m.26851 type:complete len:274 (+) Transcript_7797:905-1726(+)
MARTMGTTIGGGRGGRQGSSTASPWAAPTPRPSENIAGSRYVPSMMIDLPSCTHFCKSPCTDLQTHAHSRLNSCSKPPPSPGSKSSRSHSALGFRGLFSDILMIWAKRSVCKGARGWSILPQRFVGRGLEPHLEHVRQVQPLREPCRDGRLSYSCCAAYEHDKWDLEVVERRNHAEAVHMLLAQAVQLQQREHFVLQLLLGHVQPSLVHKALFQFQHDLRCGLLRHPRGGEHPCQQKAGQDVVVLLVRHGCRRRRRGARRGRVRGVLFMGVVV